MRYLHVAFFLGIHIPHALGVGVGHVLINLHGRLVTVGHWINGNIIALNEHMLGVVNHLPAMLATPLKQPPTPPLIPGLHEVRFTHASLPPLPPSLGGTGGSERGP